MFELGPPAEASLVEALPWFGLQLALHFSAMAVGAPAGWRRVAAPALAAPSALLAWLMPGPVLFRFISAMFSVLLVLRTIDLITWLRLPLASRLWLGFAVYEVWRVERIEPQRDLLLLRHFLLAALVTFGGLALAYLGADALREAGAGDVAFHAFRWIVGGVAVVASLDVVDVGSRLIYETLGIRLPAMQRAPIRSKTLDEFWGRRWNTVVHGWFRRHIFAPLARRGWARLGMGLSFVASVLMHVWVVAAPTGNRFIVPMGAFFALQGIFTLLERPLRVRHWRSGPARLWTLGLVALTSPLFVEPMLVIFDVR